MSTNYELNPVGYLVPSSVDDAVSLLTKYGGNAKAIAGGTDLLYLMKNHVTAHTPQYVVDLTVLNLNGVAYNSSSGLTIGATTNVSTIQSDPNVNQYYAAIAQAATGHPRRLPVRQPQPATYPRRSGAGICGTTSTAGATAETSATRSPGTIATTTASSAGTSATQSTQAT